MDILIDNGDIVIRDGDVVLIGDEMYIAQQIAHYMHTQPGSLHYSQDFGFDSGMITNNILISEPEKIVNTLQNFLLQYMQQYIPDVVDLDVQIRFEDNKAYIQFFLQYQDKLISNYVINFNFERS